MYSNSYVLRHAATWNNPDLYTGYLAVHLKEMILDTVKEYRRCQRQVLE